MVQNLQADKLKIEILDSVNYANTELVINYVSSEELHEFFTDSIEVNIDSSDDVHDAEIFFRNTDESRADCVILQVSYLKNNVVVGSSLLSDGSAELKLLKYKVELPRGAKVTLFDDDTLEAQFLAWNIPCPRSFPNMTFLQVKAANGFEQQITPSAGSQTIELYQELGRRYAVFGEIWTYSFAQTLWFADLRIQKSDYEWKDCIPTAGEGGAIVTALPQ